MQLHDRIILDGTRRRTADGYLVASAKAARSGIQKYRGDEIGKPGLEWVRVYRPAEEVFSPTSMASYAHKPVTDGHPTEPVTAANWRRLAIGHVGGTVTRDGDFVRIEVLITDAGAIEAVEGAGGRFARDQLSAGYSCALDFTPGTTPDGAPYDAVQRLIAVNHVAIVPLARAGRDARLDDAAHPTVAITDAAAAAYERHRLYLESAWRR